MRRSRREKRRHRRPAGRSGPIGGQRGGARPGQDPAVYPGAAGGGQWGGHLRPAGCFMRGPARVFPSGAGGRALLRGGHVPQGPGGGSRLVAPACGRLRQKAAGHPGERSPGGGAGGLAGLLHLHLFPGGESGGGGGFPKAASGLSAGICRNPVSPPGEGGGPFRGPVASCRLSRGGEAPGGAVPAPV